MIGSSPGEYDWTESLWRQVYVIDFLSRSCFFILLCVSLPFLDLDKMDTEKDEMNQTDIAALHHFYSKQISGLPDDQALTELFAQVQNWITIL